jgi:hypothetical protein
MAGLGIHWKGDKDYSSKPVNNKLIELGYVLPYFIIYVPVGSAGCGIAQS